MKTRRNIPRTYLTDETKTFYQSFFICPLPQALLCPVLEKIRLFLIQCVATLLLCYLSRAQAAAESRHSAGTKRSCSCTRALSPQVLPIAERKLTCFFLRPLLLLTVRKKPQSLESSAEPRGSGMAAAMPQLNLGTWPGAEDKLAPAGQDRAPGSAKPQRAAAKGWGSVPASPDPHRLSLLLPQKSGSTLLGGQSVKTFFPVRSRVSTNLQLAAHLVCKSIKTPQFALYM